jgi:monoterpene epsilon-lactone hydrolase
MAMQSWQTDLLNLYLKTTVKPMLRHARSIRTVRWAMTLSDKTAGRLLIPRDTQVARAAADAVDCRCDWIDTPNSQPGRVILYLPGGAYISRTPNLHTSMVSRLCTQSGARALICYYRLAPEHPFPACLEDSVAAYNWLLEQGYQPEQISIAGDSAGGGLTLSTLLKLRDLKRPLPACAVMMSPLLDVGDMAPSRTKNALSDSALPHPNARGINPRPLFLGAEDPKGPLVSPIYGEYQGLPPMYVLVSDSEMLLDDSLRLARRAQLFNVTVRVDIWRRVPHVWTVMSFLPESKDGLQRMGKFIAAHTSNSQAGVKKTS